MAERKASEAGLPKLPNPAVSFPTHNSPRVWFLTSALSPLAVRLIKLLLAHGDHVAAGLPPSEIADDEPSVEYRELINECKSGRKDRDGWKDRIRGIRCDGRVMGQCGAAVAEAIEVFGRVDILLCCTSEAIIAPLPTLTSIPNLTPNQFDNYFTPLNFIRATLPHLRSRHNGHIVVLTSISGHIGTPGMSMYCAATWALEGYCDSLAYEIAPFNIKLTIVQPNKEVNVLCNKIVLAPKDEDEEGRGAREIFESVLNSHPRTRIDEEVKERRKDGVIERYPILPSESWDRLVLETVHALTTIGGHENPPMRHIVGCEAVAAVEDKLRIMSQEMESFMEASYTVDDRDSELGRAAFAARREEGQGDAYEEMESKTTA